MSSQIKRDSLEVLVALYNHKTERKRVGIEALAVQLNLSPSRLLNAYEYLKEKGLIRPLEGLGQTKDGLPNVSEITVTAQGVDVIEEENLFRKHFGELKIQNQGGSLVIVQGNSNTVNKDSPKVELFNSNENNINAIHGPANITNIQNKDNSVKYTVKKKDDAWLKNLAITLLSKFGEAKLNLISALASITGLISILVGSEIPTWLPKLPAQYKEYVLIGGAYLLAFGMILTQIIRYKYESKCPKCGAFFALDEIGTPHVVEVNAYENIHKTITREYRCNKCGNITKKDTIEVIPK